MIDVRIEGEVPPDRLCVVTVASDDGTSTTHEVTVSTADLERWGGAGGLEALVRRSFEFLLEREPKESIFRRFDLSVIPRYFPEFDREFPGGT